MLKKALEINDANSFMNEVVFFLGQIKYIKYLTFFERVFGIVKKINIEKSRLADELIVDPGFIVFVVQVVKPLLSFHSHPGFSWK